MFGIRHDIIASVMAHSIVLAVALLIGGSSEIRKAGLMTVLLFDENFNSSSGRQTAIADVKMNAKALVSPKTAKMTTTKSAAAQDSMPKQNLTPLAPLKPLSDADRGSAPGFAGIETQNNSSEARGGIFSSDSNQTFHSGHSDTGTGSAMHGRTEQATNAESDASIKQSIRNALQANLVYPYIARKRRMEGTVLMEFRINGRGLPEGVRIVKGSNYAILDEAARETVLKSSPFPARNNIIEVPIRFSLRAE